MSLMKGVSTPVPSVPLLPALPHHLASHLDLSLFILPSSSLWVHTSSPLSPLLTCSLFQIHVLLPFLPVCFVSSVTDFTCSVLSIKQTEAEQYTAVDLGVFCSDVCCSRSVPVGTRPVSGCGASTWSSSVWLSRTSTPPTSAGRRAGRSVTADIPTHVTGNKDGPDHIPVSAGL